MDEPGARRGEWAALGGLVAAALAIRIVVAGFTNVVSQDAAVYYLPQARAIAEGDWENGFVANIPFLYPLLAAIAYKLIGSLETAGQAVSVLAGTLTVLPVYFLGRAIGEAGGAGPLAAEARRRTGLLAAGLAAISPLLVRYSGQGQSDALFGLLLATSFLIALRLLERPRAGSALLAGGVGGLAYLVRPEALGLLALVAALLAMGCLRKRVRLLPAAGVLGLLVVAFGVVGFPQVWVTHERTGVWTASAKAGAIFRYGHDPDFRPLALGESGERTTWEESFTGEESYVRFSPWETIAADPGGFAAGYGRDLGKMLLYLPRDFGVALFVAAIVIGILHALGGGGTARGEGFLGATVLFYVLALPLFYTSRRMWVPLIPFLLPLVARRFAWVWDRWPGSLYTHLPELRMRAKVWRVALLLIFGLTTVQAFRPVAKYGWKWQWSPEKQAGLSLRGMIKKGAPILGHDGRVAFYAGGTHLPLPGGTPDEVFTFFEKRGASLWVFEEGWLRKRRPELECSHWELYSDSGFWAVYPSKAKVLFIDATKHVGNGRTIFVGRLFESEDLHDLQTGESRLLHPELWEEDR